MFPVSANILRPPWLPPSQLRPYLPLRGPVAHAIRLTRLAYFLFVSAPIATIGYITDAVLGTNIMPKAQGRSTFASIVVSFIGGLIYSITYGLPPARSPAASSLIDSDLTPLIDNTLDPINDPAPSISTYLFTGPDAQGSRILSAGTVVPSAPEEDCLGVLATGFQGRVERTKVGGNWLWLESKHDEPISGGGRAGDKAHLGERVILYFVGGGYVSGTPLLGPQAYSLLRSSQSPRPSRLLALSYRLATDPSKAFPAGLQDALAAYSHLVRVLGFEPRDITLAGDSAGGGLAWSLCAYLGVLRARDHDEQGSKLDLPGRVGLFSPWLDLTGSQPSIKRNELLDVLNHNQMTTAVRAYLGNLPESHRPHAYYPTFPLRTHASLETQFGNGQDLLSEDAFIALSNHHPLYSPSALALAVGRVGGPGSLEFTEAFSQDDQGDLLSSPSSSSTDTSSSSHLSTRAAMSSHTPSGTVNSSSTTTHSSSRLPVDSLGSDPSSTSAPLLTHLLKNLVSSSSLKGRTTTTPPRFFIHHGSAELFADEIVFFSTLLRSHGIPVESYVEQGGFHCISAIFPPRTAKGRRRKGGLLGRIGDWLGIGQAEARAASA